MATFDEALAAHRNGEPDPPPHPADVHRNPRNPRNPVTQPGGDGYEVTGVTPPSRVVYGRGDSLMTMTFPDLAWHIPNVIPEGFTLLVGAPKVGKSWLVLGMVLATATGGKVLGERLEPRPVLYLSLEDSERRLQSRGHALGYGLSDAHALSPWSYVTNLPAGVPASDVIRRWVDTLPDLDPAPMIVVDTLGRVRGARRPSESPYDHDYRIGAAIKLVADEIPGSSLSAVHHDRKAESADFVDAVSGTNGLAGSADTIVVLRRERNKPDGVILVTGRDVNEAAYGVTFADGHWALIGGTWAAAQASAARVSAVAGRGDLAQRIVAWLDLNAAGTPKEIAIALDEQPNTVKQSLYRMYSDGLLDRAGGSYFLPAPSLLTSPTPTIADEEF